MSPQTEPASEPISKTLPTEANVKDNRFWRLFFNAFRLRCPVCKDGKIFPRWFDFEPHCPVCGVEVEREAGYFLGSIYFNYGATCSLVIVTYIVCRFGLRWPDKFLIPSLLAFTIVFPLYFLRYARSSWLVFDQYFQPRKPPTSTELKP